MGAELDSAESQYGSCLVKPACRDEGDGVAVVQAARAIFDQAWRVELRLLEAVPTDRRSLRAVDAVGEGDGVEPVEGPG